MTADYRRFTRIGLLAFLLGLLPCVAAAEDWVEPRFDPPVGSQWAIAREVNIEKNTGGTLVGHTLKETALLTVEQKTADGFVMTYARQGSTYEGDPAGASAQRIAFAALQGVVMRVATDASGKPLRIINFAEAKAALKDAIASQPAITANPEILASLHRVADRMMAVDDKQAAELYLDALPILAVAQNTGLQPGEMHKSTLPVANLLVSGITKNLTLSIATDDPSSGDVRYLMTETFDADSMKALIGETIKELNPTNVNAAAVDRAMKSAVVFAIARSELDVAGGMTHELRRQSITSFRAPGSSSFTTEDELVTVSPSGAAATE